MIFGELHKRVTYLVALLGLSALSLGSVLAPPLFFAFLAFAVASWFIDEQRFLSPVWSRVVNTLVLVAAIVQIARASIGTPILTVVIEFVGFLQVTRLYHRRGALDHQHIAVIALIHLLSATILSAGLDYAIIFLCFVVVTPWILALNHLRSEIEGQYAKTESEVAAGPSAAARRLLRSPLVGARFLWATAILALPLFIVTSLLFLLFPRVGMGFITLGAEDGSTMVGFGDDVELGGFGRIRDDPSVVMRVTPPRLPENPPPRIALRMRGTSFDAYDGRRWSRHQDEEILIRSVGPDYPLRRRARPHDPTYDIIVDPMDQHVLFLPPGAIAVKVEPKIRGGFQEYWELEHRSGLDVRYRGGEGQAFAYQAVVPSPPSERDPPMLTRPLTEAQREAYMQVPPGYERIAALARQVSADGPGAVSTDDTANTDDPGQASDAALDDYVRARRLQAYLRSEVFRYTLDQPDTGDADPLEHFLFTARAGHCEYFSTAMAIMLRTIGIPSRNVTGFVGGRFNGFGRYYAIHGGDAHSWVEAYIDDEWRVFDPTPTSRGGVGISAGDSWLTPIRQIADAMRTAWARRVIGYDMRSQVAGLRAMFNAFGGGSPGSSGSADEERDGGASSLGALMLVPSLLLVGLAVVLLRRRRKGAEHDDEHVARAIRLYRALDARLKRSNLARPASRTPREHLQRLTQLAAQAEPDGASASNPALTTLATEITEAYLATRYAGAPLEQARATELERRLKRA